MNTAERVIAVIDHLAADNQPHGVTEISRELGFGKSAVYRILSSLKKSQWVAQNSETHRYTLGSRLLELGLSFVAGSDFRSASLSHLEELRSATRETATLSMYDGFERIVVDVVQGYYEVRHIADVGTRVPLWYGASGKVILAHMDENEIETVMGILESSGERMFASGQPIDIDRLREELGKIRRQGFALSSGEHIVATSAVAAPIFGHSHRVVGAIAVSGPLPRFTVDLARRYGPMLSQAARKISLRLGGSKQNAERDK